MALFMVGRLFLRVGVVWNTHNNNDHEANAPLDLLRTFFNTTATTTTTTNKSNIHKTSTANTSTTLHHHHQHQQHQPLVVIWKNRTVSTIPENIRMFYSDIRSDRSGAMIVDMLMAHAFSYATNRTYGGVCGKNQVHSPDHRRMIQALYLTKELPYPKHAVRCHQINTSVAWALPRNAYNRKDTGIFTPEWIQYMQQQQEKERAQEKRQQRRQQQVQQNQRVQQQQQQLPPSANLSSLSSSPFRFQPASSSDALVVQYHRIMVYIRRGDVTPCIDANFRYLPNSHYLQLLDQYTTTNDTTTIMYHVTIYSQSGSFEGWHDFERRFQHQQENVRYEFKLDGDMSLVWRDMLGWSNDDDHPPEFTYYSRIVFILSRSAFGLVPALFLTPKTTNTTTTTATTAPAIDIVYTPHYFHQPLPHWHVVDPKLVGQSFARVAKLRREQCHKRGKSPEISSLSILNQTNTTYSNNQYHITNNSSTHRKIRTRQKQLTT
jgi:hypothetical protein